jgi:CRISPR/Cas system CSM-associated protein Csm3 (group 7 of RAMP superfamily)
MQYTKKYLARITIEALTAFAVGSGEKGLTLDRLAVTDANGLPYIPGTSLAGVVRHELNGVSFVDDIFGFSGSNGKGSRLIFSSALLVGDDGKTVIEGLKNIDFTNSFYSFFNRLPERDHVKIDHKGAAQKHGKFDEQLVFKGTRFVFEIELTGNDSDSENWKMLLNIFSNPVFRIGSGTRKGFGKFRIINHSSLFKIFDLTAPDDLLAYLNKSSSLNQQLVNWDNISFSNSQSCSSWIKYSLTLKAKDFFMFGAGFGDQDVDSITKNESFFDWQTGIPIFKRDNILIPATSIKGAISHRVAFNYNKLTQAYVGNLQKSEISSKLDMTKALEDYVVKRDIQNINFKSNSHEWTKVENEINADTFDNLSEWSNFLEAINDEVASMEENIGPVGENNLAVKELFGFSKSSKMKDDGLRGRVIIDDIYLDGDKSVPKIFNHVKIDRFTGGTIDGALFQEKVARYDDDINLHIWVESKALVNQDIKNAFEQTLQDLTTGNLQLGGNTSKGHGVFTGHYNIQ